MLLVLAYYAVPAAISVAGSTRVRSIEVYVMAYRIPSVEVLHVGDLGDEKEVL